jgi:hypothetical protein
MSVKEFAAKKKMLNCGMTMTLPFTIKQGVREG